MTTSKSEPLQVTLSEEARQALANATTPELPTAATEARDQLLRAIGREAEHLAATQPGQASAPLAELARAYAQVTRAHSISLVAHVPTNGFYVVPTDADLVNKDQDMSYSPTTGR
ncbi:hypothetical protein ACIBSV_36900 [Embleya sp. NPDC050154]|uniref:hypothetical protein n=1 Tax=Embleya sp. NPDC050154 TaxID=3363988 RepID=UPI00378DC0FB